MIYERLVSANVTQVLIPSPRKVHMPTFSLAPLIYCCETWWICLFRSWLIHKYTRGFRKIQHSGSTARIVLEEQNKFTKKFTSNRDLTWCHRTLVAFLLQSHAFPTVLIPNTWKTKTLKILYSCVLLILAKVNWCTDRNKYCSLAKIDLDLAQNRRAIKVLWSQIQSLLEVTSSLNLFCCSSTILAALPKWYILGKPRLLGKVQCLGRCRS